jgi:SAM-dependent methyltransferase
VLSSSLLLAVKEPLSLISLGLKIPGQVITLREHQLDSEGVNTTSANLNDAQPYFLDPSAVGYWLIIYGHLLSHLKLSKGSELLEIGFGPGGLTENFVRAGINVTAVESNLSNCNFIHERVARFGKNIATLHGDIDTITLTGEFDAIVFFESFHHVLKPARMIRKLRAHLKITGCIILAAEPIVPNDSYICPYPWGLRLDGNSLAAARDVGWIEFGYQEIYLEKLFNSFGFKCQKHFLKGYHHSTLNIFTIDSDLMLTQLKNEAAYFIK